MSEGYNATNLGSYNERLLHKSFIESLKSRPEIVVLGSSRSQLIDNSFTKEKKLVNNSLTGATIEDIIALYNIYDLKSIDPQTVIIELSPWLLNENNNQLRWKVIQEDYNTLLPKINNDNIISIKNKWWEIPPEYAELVSFEYFQESIKYFYKNNKEENNPFLFTDSLFEKDYSLDSLYKEVLESGFNYKPKDSESKIEFLNRLLKKDDFYAQWASNFKDFELMEETTNLIEETNNYTNNNALENSVKQENIVKRNRSLMEITFWENCPIAEASKLYKTMKRDNNDLTIIADGSISYPTSFRTRTPEQVNYAAQSFVNSKLFGVDNFHNISKENAKLIELFTNFLIQKNINIIYILVPFHPTVYSAIEKDYPNIIRSEQVFKTIAHKYKLKCYGSFNPEKINIKATDFYDGMHLDKESLKSIINLN